jgi:muramoyltetrapeptide carboxypeptidase
MIELKPLVKGDTILIISPAKAIDKSLIDLAISIFESWGLKVEVGANALGKHHYFSGTDVERSADLQWALNHPYAKAIVNARGGYGAIRIVDEVDYSEFRINPKWITGFSDVTVFHNKLHGTFNLPSIHAVAPLYFDRLKKDDEPLETMRKALFGEQLSTRLATHKCNRVGAAEGILVGGNLAIMASLIGTSIDIDTDGKILFIEDVSEYAYRFDRMMWSLKKSGKLKNLAGLVIGGLTDMKLCNETFGSTVEELVQDVVKSFDFPVMYGYPSGHLLDNRAIVLGTEYTMNVTNEGAELIQVKNGGA